MEPNELTLNPHSDTTATPICPLCEEEIQELSSDVENRFVCGCNKLIEFEIPVIKPKNK